MEQRLKQRLLGTAVLVALAVIIVPEVVKTSGPVTAPAVATSIPPRPESPQPGGVTVALPPAILPQAVPPEAPAPSGQAPASTIAQSPVIEPLRTPATLPLPSASAGGDGPQGMRTVDLGAGAPRVAPASPAPAAPLARPAAPKPAPVVASAPASKPAQTPAAGATPSKPAPETARATTDAPKPKPEVVAKAAPATVTPAATARPVSLPKIELTSRDTSRASASAPAAEPWRPQASNGSWAVQVGSFGVEENANLLRDRLRSQRFPAVVERIRGGSGQAMYRVRVVGQDSRPASEAIASRLRSAGVAANIVEPGE
ncbi:MAG TPA: SPOR domain-containing protein [Plasticicumulans sp.]|nr:SPOR domain-containing protein [Plasticicumulans sp.]